MEHNSTESNKKTIGNYTWIFRKQSGIVIKFDNNVTLRHGDYFGNRRRATEDR